MVPIKEVSGLFHDVEHSKDNMWEADPNLERGITIGQVIENEPALYHKLNEKASTDNLLQRNKTS